MTCEEVCVSGTAQPGNHTGHCYSRSAALIFKWYLFLAEQPWQTQPHKDMNSSKEMQCDLIMNQ